MRTDLELLGVAYEYAIHNSTDPSTQNGAVLVHNMGKGRERVVVANGANHFPAGVKESPERWERPAKYAWVEHAERNAIFDAAYWGVATNNLTMYCPWFACTDCARAIIQSGIKEVVGHDTPIHAEGSQSWKDSIKIAYTMFDEAGVKMRFIPGKLGFKIRFNGKVVEI
jgi:dCMP deaminase